MDEIITNNDFIVLLAEVNFYLFIAKAKTYFFAVGIAFVSGFIKYIQDKRTGLETSFKEFIMFSVVASLITLSALAIMSKLGMEVDFLSMMIMFWLGIFTDYIYQGFGKIIEAILFAILKIIEVVGGSLGKRATSWIENKINKLENNGKE